MGLFAPSIHSDSVKTILIEALSLIYYQDLEFWKQVAAAGTFWLDAYCPKAGHPYAWKDETPTDYYGPNFGSHIHIYFIIMYKPYRTVSV